MRLDDDWYDWRFYPLLEADQNSTHSKPLGQGQQKPPKREKAFQAREEAPKPKPCVYCNSEQHKSVDCDKVKGETQRNARSLVTPSSVLIEMIPNIEQASAVAKQIDVCGGRHHTSICDKGSKTPQRQMMLAWNEDFQTSVVYPVVVASVGGITYRALLDTGAGGLMFRAS